jgi:hypothetical protein
MKSGVEFGRGTKPEGGPGCEKDCVSEKLRVEDRGEVANVSVCGGDGQFRLCSGFEDHPGRQDGSNHEKPPLPSFSKTASGSSCQAELTMRSGIRSPFTSRDASRRPPEGASKLTDCRAPALRRISRVYFEICGLFDSEWTLARSGRRSPSKSSIAKGSPGLLTGTFACADELAKRDPKKMSRLTSGGGQTGLVRFAIRGPQVLPERTMPPNKSPLRFHYFIRAAGNHRFAMNTQCSGDFGEIASKGRLLPFQSGTSLASSPKSEDVA